MPPKEPQNINITERIIKYTGNIPRLLDRNPHYNRVAGGLGFASCHPFHAIVVCLPMLLSCSNNVAFIARYYRAQLVALRRHPEQLRAQSELAAVYSRLVKPLRKALIQSKLGGVNHQANRPVSAVVLLSESQQLMLLCVTWQLSFTRSFLQGVQGARGILCKESHARSLRSLLQGVPCKGCEVGPARLPWCVWLCAYLAQALRGEENGLV
eukprot:1146263-Pelagomonas_calceolata.AAC.7